MLSSELFTCLFFIAAEVCCVSQDEIGRVNVKPPYRRLVAATFLLFQGGDCCFVLLDKSLYTPVLQSCCMERALLMIVSIVFVVGLVGLLTVLPSTDGGRKFASNDLTGNVVVDATANECGSCFGVPVCAAKDGRARNYDNACAARCDDAKILYNAVCERIPRAQK